MKHQQESARLVLLLPFLLAGPAASRPAAATEPIQTRIEVKAALQHAPLTFEANQGQTDRRVQFLARGQGYNLFLTPKEAVLVLRKAQRERRGERGAGRKTKSSSPAPSPLRPSQSAVLRMKLLGANPHPKANGQEPLPGQVNYFLGNNSKKWRTNVPTYAKVRYHSVYPGIDLVYYGNQEQLEYDFIVQPGANPRKIALSFEGAYRVRIDKQGELVLQTRGGEVRWHRPIVYQQVNGKRRAIAAKYTLLTPEHLNTRAPGHRIGFQVARYDRTRPLVIDPVLAYSTYLGGSVRNGALGVAVDSAGYVYLTGWSISSDFPTRNALQNSLNVNVDAFVTKLDTTQTGTAQLLYSTYLGGSSEEGEIGRDIAVDGAGCVYVMGDTCSTDFPTRNAFQGSYRSRFGITFVTKLDTTKSGDASLLYSTYLGGSDGESGYGIAVDGVGYAYVTGFTFSPDFPLRNPLQDEFFEEIYCCVFVTKLDTTKSGDASLVYSTYLTGGWYDIAYDIAVDAAGYIYVVGETNSWWFPTRNAFQYGKHGRSDIFVTKLDPTKSGFAQLLYSTYLGGDEEEGDFYFGSVGMGMVVDGAGCVYVTGWTRSANFPTRHAYQDHLQGGFDAFVTKLDTTKSGYASLLYSTYLGGRDWDERGEAIALDAAGHVYVTGWTQSSDFPKKNAFQGYQGVWWDDYDAFVSKLDTTKSGDASLLYSTYLGGNDWDAGWAIAVDAAGYVYLAGSTYSSNFPTRNAYQHQRPGGLSAFLTKLDIRSFTLFGIITLEGCLLAEGIPLTLRFQPADGAAFTITTTLAADGAFSVSNIPANTYTIAIKGSKWLQKVVSVNASNGQVSNISVMLPAGDANNDNIIDINDLAAFIAAFDAEPTSANWNNGRADFDCNDIVDMDDLALLIRNFDLSGDP